MTTDSKEVEAQTTPLQRDETQITPHQREEAHNDKRTPNKLTPEANTGGNRNTPHKQLEEKEKRNNENREKEVAKPAEECVMIQSSRESVLNTMHKETGESSNDTNDEDGDKSNGERISESSESNEESSLNGDDNTSEDQSSKSS